MDTPQMFTLAVAASLLLIIYKSTFLPRGSLRFDRAIPWAIFLTYIGCLFTLHVVLAHRSADDVRSDSETVFFYFVACGIEIQAQGFRERTAPRVMKVTRPTWYRASWYRALAIIGLRRGVFGGFGNWPHGTGGG